MVGITSNIQITLKQKKTITVIEAGIETETDADLDSKHSTKSCLSKRAPKLNTVIDYSRLELLQNPCVTIIN